MELRALIFVKAIEDEDDPVSKQGHESLIVCLKENRQVLIRG